MADIAHDAVARQLLALEETLLDPTVRKNPARVEALLDEAFREFGASGKVWTRGAVLKELAKETGYSAPLVMDYECQTLAMGVALVTYRALGVDAATKKPQSTLRSSVWVRREQGWRIRFHQGTRASAA
jgi:hypothetical protein